MINSVKLYVFSILFCALFLGCAASGGVLSTPIENIDTSPLKETELTETEKQSWAHLDLANDTIPGMSVNKAYSEIIKNKKGKTVIVAVIDGGTDIDHEDLKDVIWTNKNEIPNNGKDDDNNGYIDDINGWNFVGDGYNEQFEYVRLLASGDRSNPRYAEAEIRYTKEFQKYTQLKGQTNNLKQLFTTTDKAIEQHLNNENYSKDDVYNTTTKDETLLQHIALAKNLYSQDYESIDAFVTLLNKDLVTINERLNYYLNKNLKGRKTGDNPNDLYDQLGYGNNNPRPSVKDESHGTHVSGIIAAKRNNNIGINGVANNVKIMTIRSTPNGDEYDKDVALAIRYAVDNGAQIINMSFGKLFSPNFEWVKEAILYAAKKDVLIVHAAGNDSDNIDAVVNFPNDTYDGQQEFTDNFINVGALTSTYGTYMVADYSNYGKVNVDVFAPGSDIYSSFPKNEYESINGTSMAAPNVAGVAALVLSQYPSLTASQLKTILIDSGLPIKAKVIVGKNNAIKSLSEISTSGRIVNAYNALIMASQSANYN